jgi:hypothetical protein
VAFSLNDNAAKTWPTADINASYSQFNSVVCVFVLDYCSHLEATLERAGDVVGHLAGLHRALDAGTHALLAEDTDLELMFLNFLTSSLPAR